MGNLNFGQALDILKTGGRVQRLGWNGKGMYIYLETRTGFDPCIVMHTAGGTEQPGWLGSQPDMLGDDWQALPPRQ